MAGYPKKKQDPPWVKNSGSILIVYTILAAIATAILIYALADKDLIKFPNYLFIEAPLTFSIVLFIYSAEKITDAVDELDVKKLVYNFWIYNTAVVLLNFGLFSTIYLKFFTPPTELLSKQFLYLLAFIIIFLLATKKWIGDFFWLLFKNKKGFHDYLQELEGNVEAEEDQGWGMYLFYLFRKKLRGVITERHFANISIELGVSKINGIGVFAITEIKEGHFIAEGIHLEDEELIVQWGEVKHLSKEIHKKINDFCVGTQEGFYPPDNLDFNTLTVDWYLNHSCDGNVGFNEKGDFIAIKDIKKGSELTFDYALAESYDKFILHCTCGSNGCRKTITGNDWKDPEIMRGKAKYMLPYLKELIRQQ
jgi:hypothetical protein